MKKTFEFTEKERADILGIIDSQYGDMIYENDSHIFVIGHIQRIVSERITTEPGVDKSIEAFCEKHAILPETLINVYNDNLERIKSILSTPEPGESGQSAGDVNKIGLTDLELFYYDWLKRNPNDPHYGFTTGMLHRIMEEWACIHASQVCADKEREIEEQMVKYQKAWEFIVECSTAKKEKLSDLASELSAANESLTVMLRKNAELEKELEYAKIR